MSGTELAWLVLCLVALKHTEDYSQGTGTDGLTVGKWHMLGMRSKFLTIISDI